MSANTSFVLVSGAWHTAAYWEPVAARLTSAGWGAVPVALPSASSDAAAGVGGDVAAVRAAITGETARGRDVVVVAHSFGGIVGSSAIAGLAGPQAGGGGGIVGFVLVASGFIPDGMIFLDATGGQPPPFWRVSDDGFAEFTLGPDGLRDLFYHDLPADEGAAWVGRLTRHSYRSLSEGREHIRAGWQEVPCAYLATTEDRANPIAMQRLAVQMARDAGKEVLVGELATSHSPMLSRPQETADFLLRCATSFAGSK